jgi:hypothetical protein
MLEPTIMKIHQHFFSQRHIETLDCSLANEIAFTAV